MPSTAIPSELAPSDPTRLSGDAENHHNCSRFGFFRIAIFFAPPSSAHRTARQPAF
ncbi:hypothetical protein RSSM_01639 [Rhodopirellula sallentina SM41]|uniref:Uncharacterized protein n=1 Tax=Rhodopirellula sallentina SM41 TaxID=1263870 RepID=M5ULR0_9BACT|nr:hypothetical protein RSSM_01639 [Rhodopirellula sallentina SM41]